MSRKKRRLTLIASAGIALAISAALVLTALEDTIVFFKTPTELATGEVAEGVRVRIGGLVEEGSINKSQGKTVHFAVTDTANTVPVTYVGILPDLFREGQGVVAEGMLQGGGVFKADTVLARHDENYMPPEVAEALKRQGVWQHGGEGEDASANTYGSGEGTGG